MNDYFKKAGRKETEFDKVLQAITITVIAIIFLTLAGTGIYYFIQANKFTTWTHSSGISIKYPKTWTAVAGEQGALVVFLSPRETDLDVFQENVNISIQDLSRTPMLLDEYTQIAINQLQAVFGNVTIIKSESTTVDYLRAHELIFEAESEYPLTVHIVWLVKGDYAYTVTFISLKNNYERYLPLVNEMFKSFSLGDKLM